MTYFWWETIVFLHLDREQKKIKKIMSQFFFLLHDWKSIDVAVPQWSFILRLLAIFLWSKKKETLQEAAHGTKECTEAIIVISLQQQQRQTYNYTRNHRPPYEKKSLTSRNFSTTTTTTCRGAVSEWVSVVVLFTDDRRFQWINLLLSRIHVLIKVCECVVSETSEKCIKYTLDSIGLSRCETKGILLVGNFWQTDRQPFDTCQK